MKSKTERNRHKEKTKIIFKDSDIYSRVIESFMDGYALLETVLSDEENPTDYRFLDVNPAFETMFRCKRLDIIDKTIRSIIPGLELTLLNKYREVEKTGRPVRFEYLHTKQQRFFELIAFNPVSNQFFLFFRDITDKTVAEAALKKSLQEKELLLREIHHRVKNNLAMVSSLLNIQSTYIKDDTAKIAFAESRKRISSIALIHEKLYLSPNLASIEFSQYIQELTNTLIKSYSIPTELVKVIIDIENVYLNIDVSIPLGLMVTELVTNSLKYGFKGEGQLTISIKLKIEGQYMHLTVADDGIGIPASLNWKNTETLGIQLVILLTGQLKGEIHLNRDNGTSFLITIPKSDEYINK